MFELGNHLLRISVTTYTINKSLALMLLEETGEVFAVLTVNLPESDNLAVNEAFVDTNNCPWAEDFIARYQLGHKTRRTAQSGFCTYPLYSFDMSKIVTN